MQKEFIDLATHELITLSQELDLIQIISNNKSHDVIVANANADVLR
jgi:hypothetical protein